MNKFRDQTNCNGGLGGQWGVLRVLPSIDLMTCQSKKLVSLGVIKKYIISSGSLSSQTVDDRQLNALVIHYDKTRQGVGLRVRQWVKTLSVGRHAITGERQT